ncbi:MAG: beta-galactosidase, partial [Pseudomonadota bacterium]
MTIGSAGLVLTTPGGQSCEVPFLCGAIHYFHVRREHWGRCLDAAVDFGLSMVESYVPWSIHEKAPGVYDFERGDERFERDLGGFLSACNDRGIKVLLRPGPHINGELTGFGYPWRILRNKKCLAVGAQGNPVIMGVPPRCFPVPSYASERFLEESNSWLAAVGQFISPFCWPKGPVIGAQIDNEMSLFFRTAAYDQDYHPEAVALYRQYLKEKYGDTLPSKYGGKKTKEADPPRKMEVGSTADLLVHLDWMRFKEWFVVESLGRLGNMLRVQGMDTVPLIHNFPATQFGEPCGLVAAETRVELAGLDIYLRHR